MATKQSQVTVAQVRAALADVLDEGWQCGKGCDLKHMWAFPTEAYDGDEQPSDKALKLRELFMDAVVARLTELRERGLG